MQRDANAIKMQWNGGGHAYYTTATTITITIAIAIGITITTSNNTNTKTMGYLLYYTTPAQRTSFFFGASSHSNLRSVPLPTEWPYSVAYRACIVYSL